MNFFSRLFRRTTSAPPDLLPRNQQSPPRGHVLQRAPPPPPLHSSDDVTVPDRRNRLVADFTNQLARLSLTSSSPSRESRKVTLKNFRVFLEADETRKSLLTLCDQSEPVGFVDAFPPERYHDIYRIDSGTYGEVFRARDTEQGDKQVILKLMRAVPHHAKRELSKKKLNFAGSMNLEDIYNELRISRTLSAYHADSDEVTFQCFPRVFDCKLVRGDIPDYFNRDSPDVQEDERSKLYPLRDEPFAKFPHEQLPREWVVMTMEDCGFPLWKAIRRNLLTPEALKGIVYQVMMALYSGESTHQFEHRDLHISNILVKPTKEDKIRYTVSGESTKLDSHGWRVTLIDFSFSRLTTPDGEVCFKYLFRQLKSKQELEAKTKPQFLTKMDLNASRDAALGGKVTTSTVSTDANKKRPINLNPKKRAKLQDEIYIKMAETIGHDRDSWAGHHPRTNCYWLWYLMRTVSECKLVTAHLLANPNFLDNFRDLMRITYRAESTAQVVCEWKKLVNYDENELEMSNPLKEAEPHDEAISELSSGH